MPSNSFQTNLDTAINPSNNYIANALKPNISPGDKCSKIIPTSFKDTILSANTTSSSGQYNKKKITGKTERQLHQLQYHLNFLHHLPHAL